MAPDDPPRVPEPVEVEDLAVRQDNLVWTVHGETMQLSTGSILFVVKSPASADQYLVCGLKESDSESAAATFELVLLRTKSLPDQISPSLLISQIPAHLEQRAGNQVDVIVSIKSGSGLALRFWQAVLRPLLEVVRQELAQASPDASSVNVVGSPRGDIVLITDSADSVSQFAQSLCVREGEGGGQQSRTIILLTGDGGIVDVLNGCSSGRERGEQSPARSSSSSSSWPPLVCPLPLGTGNALFHSLHKPVASTHPSSSPLVLGLQTLFQGAPADLPTFRASFSAGSHVVDPTAEEEQAAADEGGGQHSADADAGAGTGADAARHAIDTPLNSDKDEDGQQSKSKTRTTTTTTTTREGRAVSHLDGAVVASYGFHASIVHESDTPAYRAHGQKRFGMVAQELLREAHPYTAQVEIRRPGEASFVRIPRDAHAYVLVTPLSNLERTFTISPDSRPLDGKLRAVHFGPIGGERIMDVMMKAYAGGQHVNMSWADDGERVWYDEVDEMRLTVQDANRRWRKVCIDGTIVEMPAGGHMELAKSRVTLLRVLVPRDVLPS